MKKDISLHRYRLLPEIIGIGLMLLFCPLKADAKDTTIQEKETREPVSIITEKQLEKLYTCREDTNTDTCLCISVDDAALLMKIAYHEDHTDMTSQAYIMSEVLNRVESPDFPDTVKDVLNQKGQFLDTDSKEFKNIQPDVNSHYALALIESRAIQTDFLFHESLDSENSWQSKNRVVSTEYGGTRFYK